MTTMATKTLLTMVAAFLLLCSSYRAFRPAHVKVRAQQLHIQAASSLADPIEITKLFNRLADKYLLLDVPGAGTPGMINCCHGGCDNCDFSRIFDEMSSGRPKWVALYDYRKHPDGRDHSPPWLKLFESQPRLNKEAFIEAFAALPSAASSMGPPVSVSPDEAPSPETLAQLWDLLVSADGGADPGANEEQGINAQGMAAALQSLTGAEHGAIYSEFARLASRA